MDSKYENIVGCTRSEDLSTTEHYLSDYCLMMAVSSVNPDESKTFAEAWHHPDPMKWENWQKAVGKEFSSMIK